MYHWYPYLTELSYTNIHGEFRRKFNTIYNDIDEDYPWNDPDPQVRKSHEEFHKRLSIAWRVTEITGDLDIGYELLDLLMHDMAEAEEFFEDRYCGDTVCPTCGTSVPRPYISCETCETRLEEVLPMC